MCVCAVAGVFSRCFFLLVFRRLVVLRFSYYAFYFDLRNQSLKSYVHSSSPPFPLLFSFPSTSTSTSSPFVVAFFAFLCLIYAVKVGSLLSLAWTMDGTELAGAGGNGGVVFSQQVIFLFIFDVRAKQMSRHFFFPISQQQAFLLT